MSDATRQYRDIATHTVAVTEWALHFLKVEFAAFTEVQSLSIDGTTLTFLSFPTIDSPDRPRRNITISIAVNVEEA
jgi:hypothetical protein